MEKETRLRAFVVFSIGGAAFLFVMAWLFSWHIAIPSVITAILVSFAYWVYLR